MYLEVRITLIGHTVIFNTTSPATDFNFLSPPTQAFSFENPRRAKMARAVICRRAIVRDQPFGYSIFLRYNSIGALYGNNLIPWLLLGLLIITIHIAQNLV